MPALLSMLLHHPSPSSSYDAATAKYDHQPHSTLRLGWDSRDEGREDIAAEARLVHTVLLLSYGRPALIYDMLSDITIFVSILQIVSEAPVVPISGKLNPLASDLDRSNVNNAYVSGMREELNMQGTDFNVSLIGIMLTPLLNLATQKINTFFTIGYIIGMIPSTYSSHIWLCQVLTKFKDNLAIQFISPRIWFPLMQIIWGILTFAWAR